MPVLWTVSQSTRLVMVTVKGVIRLKDVEDYLERVMGPATMSFHKLVDLSESFVLLSQQDLAGLAERVRDYARSGPLGALAVVVTSDGTEQIIQQFGSLTGAERPW